MNNNALRRRNTPLGCLCLAGPSSAPSNGRTTMSWTVFFLAGAGGGTGIAACSPSSPPRWRAGWPAWKPPRSLASRHTNPSRPPTWRAWSLSMGFTTYPCPCCCGTAPCRQRGIGRDMRRMGPDSGPFAGRRSPWHRRRRLPRRRCGCSFPSFPPWRCAAPDAGKRLPRKSSRRAGRGRPRCPR